MWPALHHGSLSWRRFEVLVEHLPVESATKRAIIGPAAVWDTTDHLLALVADLLAAGNWQRGGGKGKRPKPLKRPGDKRGTERYGGKSKRPLTPAAMKRIDQRWSQLTGRSEATTRHIT